MAQPISNRHPAAPNITHIMGRILCISSDCNGTTRIVSSAKYLAYCWRMRAAIVSTSACACLVVVPFLRRARTREAFPGMNLGAR